MYSLSRERYKHPTAVKCRGLSWMAADMDILGFVCGQWYVSHLSRTQSDVGIACCYIEQLDVTAYVVQSDL